MNKPKAASNPTRSKVSKKLYKIKRRRPIIFEVREGEKKHYQMLLNLPRHFEAKQQMVDIPPPKIPIRFRSSVPEIPLTTYGTFSIYKYPAKFIPQVIAYILKEYAKPGMKVFDPFAGYGTVGVVSRVYGYDYELWDLNPILNIIHDTAILAKPKINIRNFMEEIKSSHENYKPNWSNLEYWIRSEFLPVLSKTWGFAHSLQNNNKYLLFLPLLKVTRYFSNSDEKIHKLYSSKFAKQKVQMLLKANWKVKFYDMLEKEISTLIKKIEEYHGLEPFKVAHRIITGIDTLETKLDHDVDILITSPPYLQAQEYIRSTKLELFWLGFKESYINSLSKKEIPYRPVDEIKVYSESYYKYREGIKEEHLRTLYDRYFWAILNTFAKLGEKVREYMFIFVGPAKIRTTSIPIDNIIIEHLEKIGWKHVKTYIDVIVARSMFKSKINPASGIKDSRMETEHLVILKKE